MKSVLVFGASENPVRYANMAVRLLQKHAYQVYALGLRAGNIEDISIHTDWPEPGTVDTISLYVGPQRLKNYHEQLISLRPRRIIFNPGTESPELKRAALDAGIEVVENCTLVMLNNGRF